MASRHGRHYARIDAGAGVEPADGGILARAADVAELVALGIIAWALFVLGVIPFLVLLWAMSRREDDDGGRRLVTSMLVAPLVLVPLLVVAALIYAVATA